MSLRSRRTFAPLYTTLPHLPEELDILLVQKPDTRDPVTYKDFRVRKHKVLAFLQYLLLTFSQHSVLTSTDCSMQNAFFTQTTNQSLFRLQLYNCNMYQKTNKL